MKFKSAFLYLVKPLPTYFLLGLILVNIVALFHFDTHYIGAFFAFFYIIITPGFLLLSLLTQKKFPSPLGLTLSVALSVLLLMLVGLVLNTILPLLGMHEPLSTVPLIVAFDCVVYALLVLNYETKKDSAFELHDFTSFNWFVVGCAVAMPILATLGSVILNNGGGSLLTMLALSIAFILVPLLVFTTHNTDSSVPPITLYFIALSFLLMNSMRGWFITGHDILLEFHVFTLTNTAHLWSMAFYRDPYNACLSLTILPTYLQSLMHVGDAYIFKFFAQFIGALSVIMVYYITKMYSSDKIAFLASFLYISFPTFMVDMAFLNRQGIAFVFFGALLYVLFSTRYFQGRTRTALLFTFGIGMILSHYSTSYIAIPLLIIAYILNRIVRFVVNASYPQWLFRMTNKLGNKEIYQRPILISLPFVVGLLLIMMFWSSVVTKTSTGLFNTIQQIITTLEHPFSLDGYSGPAKYNLFQSKKATPEELFSQFLKEGIEKNRISKSQSDFYPLALTLSYPATPIAEQPAPITLFGEKIISMLHIDLVSFFSIIKQLYAKIIQLFLLIGLGGLILGYSFKKNLSKDIPVEYLAISVSGIIVMVGQTLLPAGAIDYGLLRLFQQNLIFLSLPIVLALMGLGGLFTRKYVGQLFVCTAILLFFFINLSGLFPQLTGGSRALLALNNSGLYYDSYYTHAEEVAATKWTARYAYKNLPVQAAHFSDIKMIAYGYVAPYIELLPETIKRRSYEYLNYNNVESGNILEIINGDVVYYHFPIEFLDSHKNLIYNNGGSEIYR